MHAVQTSPPAPADAPAPVSLVLVEPDIPQNAGTLMRACAALGVPLHVVEPCGFVLDDRRLARALMDYARMLRWTRHPSLDAFLRGRPPGRLVAVETGAADVHAGFAFRPGDMLLVGSEGGGLPPAALAAADAAVRIPMRPGARSLNVAVAASMALGEALRATGAFGAA